MADKALPSIEHLRQILDYDPETGALTWKEREPETFYGISEAKARESSMAWNGRRAGKPAGCDNGNGYIMTRIRFGGQQVKVYAHRAAWAITHGEWPNYIDHINGDRSDNRLCNLRSVSQSENLRNQRRQRHPKSGQFGVYPYGSGGRWTSKIRINGKSRHLGCFATKEDAAAAYRHAAAENGYTARHGCD